MRHREHLLRKPDGLHEGGSTSDGAYGEFTFDVAARSIALDYNERYTATNGYQHEF